MRVPYMEGPLTHPVAPRPYTPPLRALILVALVALGVVLSIAVMVFQTDGRYADAIGISLKMWASWLNIT